MNSSNLIALSSLLLTFIGVVVSAITLFVAVIISQQQKTFSEQSELRTLMLEIRSKTLETAKFFRENKNDKKKCNEVWEYLSADILEFFNPEYFENNTKINAQAIQEYRSEISRHFAGIDTNYKDVDFVYNIQCIEAQMFSIICSIFRKYPKQKSSH